MLSALSPLLQHPLAKTYTQQALMAMDPEIAHRVTIAALKIGLAPKGRSDPKELKTEICGLNLSNPIGMAAGFDKNAEVPTPLSSIGFGMVEVGTLTPHAQIGNPKPRLFRLPQVEGVINRMGFNNEGHDAAYRRLENQRVPAILGINIGANKNSNDFVADYVTGVERFAPLADYLTVNISSPNTPGLRDLQSDEALKRLLGAVLAARSSASVRVPVFLKIAPDLDDKQLDEIANVIAKTDLDGLIVSNTTLSRAGTERVEHASEAGGLSGKPLFNLATQKLAQMRLRVGALPIIGVGGINSAQTAEAKLAAGANAIQLYSALVFGGLQLLDDIKSGLANSAKKAGSISALSNTQVDDWASGKLEI